MASVESHIRQWKHNRAFLALVPADYSDWFVTVAFYVALHAVDALLAHDKVQRVTSHAARNEVLIKTNRYKAITLAYLPLYDLSRTVRYLADPSRWVRNDDLEKEILGRYLGPIEASVQRLTKQDLRLPKLTVNRSSGVK